MLVILLAGCHADRVAALEARVAERRAEVRTLQIEATRLRTELDKRPPPTASVRRDNDPPGFRLDTPLPPGDPNRPDILLVSIDTLRADHVGTYGYSRDTTPFIDSLAAQGTLFEQAWSPTSWTLPSHTTMLSGWLPIHHGAIDDHLVIPKDVPLLQESFQSAGYGTIGVVSTLFVSSRYGFDRGFDHFEDFGIKDKATNNLSTVDADHVFHRALYHAQRSDPGQPLFVFTHLYDCHYQYDPPAPWNTKFDRAPQWGDAVYKNYQAYQKNMIPKVQLDHQVAQYDEELAFTDAMLQEYVETWKANGRDLVIVVMADHGEEFGERGSWGHAHSLYPEQLHIPFVVYGEGVAVQRVKERIGTEDLAPTLAALAGVPFVSAKDGESRAEQIRTGVPPGSVDSARFAETSRFDTLIYRWHDPPWDLVVDMGAYQRELFDLSTDPLEKQNVYKGNGEKAEQMFRDMSSWLGEPWSVRSAGRLEVKEGVLFTGNGERQEPVLEVTPGTTFSVQPPDAMVVFHAPGADRPLGPWRPYGGGVPGAGCPVSYEGRFLLDAELGGHSADECEMLKALGYLGEDEPCDTSDTKATSGRIPCR